jgi:hypothetical protein
MAAKQAEIMMGHASALRSTAESFVQQMKATADTLEGLAKALREGAPAPGGAKGAKGERKPKRERDPNMPKRVNSAFFLFCAARRAEDPTTKLSPKSLTAEWAACSDEQKRVRARAWGRGRGLRARLPAPPPPPPSPPR